MRVPTVNGKIVTLKWWRFTHKGYSTLLEIQNVCPNQVVELATDDQHGRFLPIHKLDLESFHVVRNLNP